ncbi:PREDICTED: CICLE_v10030146mg partial [Prunus dulcis]|uniref:PREDICTED: CICLE_v10030146mg partial n=1 Tax=Prunus dulcis TaxID=3755 RepID=A0A5E4G932_PRUDU|nr:PREDICTED: CICLE_v10030146mg partial [Prunus dulcis]
MAEKVSEKKKKRGSSNKEGRLTKSWPDLSPQLVNLIQKDSTIMQNMSFQGVSNSWRSAPRKCNHNPSSHPWLAISQSNGHHDKNHDQYHFNNIPNPTIPCLKIPRAILTPEIYTYSLQNRQITPFTYHFFWDPRKQHQNLSHHLVGSTNGLLIAKASHNPLQYCVWDPVKSLKLDLPQWDANVPFKCAALSSAKEDKCHGKSLTVMVLTGMSHPAFMFYKIQGGSEYAWVKQDCTITDPQHHWDKSERRRYMQFTNAIGFERLDIWEYEAACGIRGLACKEVGTVIVLVRFGVMQVTPLGLDILDFGAVCSIGVLACKEGVTTGLVDI